MIFLCILASSWKAFWAIVCLHFAIEIPFENVLEIYRFLDWFWDAFGHLFGIIFGLFVDVFRDNVKTRKMARRAGESTKMEVCEGQKSIKNR